MGSIQVILDALELKSDGNAEQKIEEAHPVPVKRSTKSKQSSKKIFRGKEFVKHLIPNNINEVEFIYKVNFEPGKGLIHIYLH